MKYFLLLFLFCGMEARAQEIVHHALSTSARLIAADAVGDTVWVAGTAGTVARSLDGGQTWTHSTVPSAEALQFRDVHAWSAREALVLSIGEGEQSRIYSTDNGGASWTLRWTNPDSSAFFDAFAFFGTSGRGFVFSDAVDEHLPVWTTDNFGRTWARHPAEKIPGARPGEGAYASSGTCALTFGTELGAFVTSGGDGPDRFIVSRDAGRTWSAVLTPSFSTDPMRGLATLATRDGIRWWAGALGEVDGQTVVTSHDAGVTWQWAPPTGLPRVYGMWAMPNSSRLVATGPDGAAYSPDDGATWLPLLTGNFWGGIPLDEHRILLVGGEGRLAHITFP